MYESARFAKNDGTPVVGVVLGSGAARGWAHVGVLQALSRHGVKPDVVCGCSIGALVGAALVSDRLEQLAEWVESLAWQDVVGLLDISLRGGLIHGDRVVQYCARNFFASDFSDLSTPFACVATELSTGREVWLRDGSVADAVRASIALPGLFSPVLRAGRVLVDGGLVNPVPVSLCRALGADIVIAVELGSGMVGRVLQRDRGAPETAPWTRRMLNAIGINAGVGQEPAEGEVPSLTDVITSTINIMQTHIARSRLAGEPADVLVSPRVAHLGMMEFDKAADAIAAGRTAVEHALPSLRQALGEES